MTTPAFGTVSHGTHRTADLLLAFSTLLGDLAKRDEDESRKASASELLSDLRFAYNRAGSFELLGDTEEGQSLVEPLFDTLDEYAPPFAYFGAVEGDGSDFGFWPCIERLEEAAAEEDGVLKLNAGTPWPSLDELKQKEIDYVMEVSDHGNVTLYSSATKQELWSVV